MNCRRCAGEKEVKFLVVSDILNIAVCADCAAEARAIGGSLRIFKIDDTKTERPGARRAGEFSDRAASL